MDRIVIRSLVLVALLALLAAACGGQPTAPDEAQDGTQDQTTDANGADGADDQAGTDAEATVQTADSEYGTILTDAGGMVLYLFEQDQGDGTSTCTGQCAEAWPPLTVEGEPTAGDSLDASLLSTTEREDGSTQVVYNGHPLYYFANDGAPGDTNGQGVGDVWWVVSPEGEAIQESSGDGS